VVFNTDRGCSKAQFGGVFTNHGCRSAFPEFEFVLDCSTYHAVPNDSVCSGAGGYSKSVGKAGNDSSANDVQCLGRGGIRGTKGFQLISKVTSHASDLFPVEVHGEFHSKV